MRKTSSDYEDYNYVVEVKEGYEIDRIILYDCTVSDPDCDFRYTVVTYLRTYKEGCYEYYDYIYVYYFGHSDGKLGDAKKVLAKHSTVLYAYHDEYFISTTLHGTSCTDGVDYVIGCRNCDYIYEGSASYDKIITTLLYVENLGGTCGGYFEYEHCACYLYRTLSNEANCEFESVEKEASDFEDFSIIFDKETGYEIDEIITYTCNNTDCGFRYTVVTCSKITNVCYNAYVDYLYVCIFGHSENKLLDCIYTLEVSILY